MEEPAFYTTVMTLQDSGILIIWESIRSSDILSKFFRAAILK